MISVMYDNVTIACDTNTEFTSIIALGHAKLIVDLDFKREVLNKVVDKYTPHFSGSVLPEKMV